ncbi:MAG TPA: DNA polymerase III subunit delta [Blastocatellia bacterium]|nr:DNA polymerase III subunit delta [Blastocatellia bacterium]
MSGRPKKKTGGPALEELRREVEGGRIGPLYLFLGEEQYLQERALRLLHNTVDEALRVFNVSVFSIGSDNGNGSKTTAAMVIDAANQMPMMSSRRIVVVREFDKIKEDEQELVLAYLKNPAPTTTMVFQAVSPDKRRKLTAALMKTCAVMTFDLLDESRASRWAEERLKERGCSIEPGALRLLIGLVGTGLTRLVNELEKLAAYADGGAINSATVQELVPRASEHTSWELWDAINARDRKRALKLMERLLDDSDALPILGSLASLYRRLLTGKELVEGGASSQEITKATGQWSQTFLNRLRRASRSEIVHGLRRIAEVDNAIKNSEGTPRLQMQYLVAELTLSPGAKT